MRPMKVEVDERNASAVGELVASSDSESDTGAKLRGKPAPRSRVMIT